MLVEKRQTAFVAGRQSKALARPINVESAFDIAIEDENHAVTRVESHTDTEHLTGALGDAMRGEGPS